MIPLLLLAEKVEGLSGPDREVDCLIWCHVRGIEPRWVGTDARLLDAGDEGIIGWIDPGKEQRNFSTSRQSTGPNSIPTYTASVDAALSLVPENADSAGERFRLEAYNSPGVLAPHVRASAWVAGAARVYAATPALALVAASLRAREAMEAGG